MHFALREVLQRCADEDQYQSIKMWYGTRLSVRSSKSKEEEVEVQKIRSEQTRFSREPGNLASKTKSRNKLRTRNPEPNSIPILEASSAQNSYELRL